MFSAVAGHLVVEQPLDLFNLLYVTYLCTPRSPAVLCCSQMWLARRGHGSVTIFSTTQCAQSAHDISHFHERRLPTHFLVLSALPIPSLGPHRGTLDLALMLCLFLTLSSLSYHIFMCLSRALLYSSYSSSVFTDHPSFPLSRQVLSVNGVAEEVGELGLIKTETPIWAKVGLANVGQLALAKVVLAKFSLSLIKFLPSFSLSPRTAKSTFRSRIFWRFFLSLNECATFVSRSLFSLSTVN